MKCLCSVAAAFLLVVNLNGCSSSSSAQLPGMQGAAIPLGNVDQMAVLSSGRVVFTSYADGSPILNEVWSTDFTDEGTQRLLTEAAVVQIAFPNTGMVWRGKAIIQSSRSELGLGGGMFWLSDGTVEGTTPFFDISDAVLITEVSSVAIEGDILIIEAFYFDPVTHEHIETRLIRVNLLAPNS